jgi:hypothetical protein
MCSIAVYLMGLAAGMLVPACFHLCGVVPYDQIPATSGELPAYFLGRWPRLALRRHRGREGAVDETCI